MSKKNMSIGIIIAILLLGIGLWYISTPRYIIIQEKRSISLNGMKADDFVIKPAKILVTNLWNFRPLTIPITVVNGEGKTDFIVENKNPAIFDKGYFNADDFGGYSFKVDKKSLSLPSNTNGLVNITVSKDGFGSKLKQEKGIAITQVTDAKGLNLSRSYVFEILID